MSELSTQRVVKFRKNLKNLLDTPAGKDVLDFLQESYVDIPVVSETPEITYYRLGQKEFVQGLIKDATTDLEELENLTKGG